jgi:uncharacterized protein
MMADSTQRANFTQRAPKHSIAPDALGLGLRVDHYEYLFEHWPAVDYFEIISENFLGDAAPPLRRLTEIKQHYPIVLHGVGLNLLGHAPLSEPYLDRLCRLADFVDAPFVTDHLCWTGAHGINHHDLLPTPYLPALVELAAERAAYVQRRLGRPFGLENLSSYVEFRSSTMSEWEFYNRVVRAADCYYMLDINNVYVSSQNHDFDPYVYLASIDYSRVLQTHLAGHTREPSGAIVDTHDQPVTEAVWALYRDTYREHGPFPTLLEWDEKIPAMPAVLAELAKAGTIRSSPPEAAR